MTNNNLNVITFAGYNPNKQIVINEIVANPRNINNVPLDTNNDGIAYSWSDSFIELYNKSENYVNLSNWKIWVENSYGNKWRHTFKKRKIIKPKSYLTVWGAGTPKGFNDDFDICSDEQNDGRYFDLKYKTPRSDTDPTPEFTIVRLYDNNNNLIDTLGYGSGQSVLMISNNVVCRYPDGAVKAYRIKFNNYIYSPNKPNPPVE